MSSKLDDFLPDLSDFINLHAVPQWRPSPKEIIGRGYQVTEPRKVPQDWKRVNGRRLAELVLSWDETVLMYWEDVVRPKPLDMFRDWHRVLAPRRPVWFVSAESYQRLATLCATLDEQQRKRFWRE